MTFAQTPEHYGLHRFVQIAYDSSISLQVGSNMLIIYQMVHCGVIGFTVNLIQISSSFLTEVTSWRCLSSRAKRICMASSLLIVCFSMTSFCWHFFRPRTSFLANRGWSIEANGAFEDVVRGRLCIAKAIAHASDNVPFIMLYYTDVNTQQVFYWYLVL